MWLARYYLNGGHIGKFFFIGEKGFKISRTQQI